MKASVNQRSIVPSAILARPFASFTAATRGAQVSLAPGGVAGIVSQSIIDLRSGPCLMAKAWPVMPPIERPI